MCIKSKVGMRLQLKNLVGGDADLGSCGCGVLRAPRFWQ